MLCYQFTVPLVLGLNQTTFNLHDCLSGQVPLLSVPQPWGKPDLHIVQSTAILRYLGPLYMCVVVCVCGGGIVDTHRTLDMPLYVRACSCQSTPPPRLSLSLPLSLSRSLALSLSLFPVADSHLHLHTSNHSLPHVYPPRAHTYTPNHPHTPDHTPVLGLAGRRLGFYQGSAGELMRVDVAIDGIEDVRGQLMGIKYGGGTARNPFITIAMYDTLI